MSGFRGSNNNGRTYYLSVNGNGNVYEKSKEPKEGFVEHINPNTGQLSGYWREYYNGFTVERANKEIKKIASLQFENVAEAIEYLMG